MSTLDSPPVAAHTLAPDLGEANQMFRVYKTRRRDRRGKPWMLRWDDPPGSGRRRNQTIGSMSDRMAERHRELWQAELNGLLFGEDPGGSVRWADFVRRYLESAATGLQPSSLAIARQTLARFGRICRPRLLSQVDRAMIDRYRVARAAEVGPRTQLKDLRTLRSAFAWAESVDMIAANPISRRLRLHGRLARPDPDALSVEQTAAFLAALAGRPTWVQASLRLACLWGPRAKELAGIERGDIDLGHGTIRIPVAGERRTKEARGKTVPVDAETGGLLQELSHRDCPVLWGPLDRPFTTAAGKGGFTRTLGRTARTILEDLGVRPRDGKPLQFLRRTADTNMRRRGVPDWMIGAILGHGTRVGEEFYSGVSPDEIAGQVAQLMRGFVTRG